MRKNCKTKNQITTQQKKQDWKHRVCVACHSGSEHAGSFPSNKTIRQFRLLSSYIQKWNLPEDKKLRAPLKWYSDLKPRL